MSSRLKKYIFIVLLLVLSLGVYWIFYSPKWGVALDNEHTWKYGFQEKGVSNLEKIKWNPKKGSKEELEKNRLKNLVFQSTFILNNYTKILEGLLEYDYHYSTKILINGTEYSDINKNLITPSIEDDKIIVTEYWRPRKVKLNGLFLKNHLKNGENTITIIVYNLEDIKSISLNKKQLSFLSKGNANELNTSFEIQKPSDYFSQSKLPIFKINTNNSTIPDEPKIKASLNVINNKSGTNLLSDPDVSHHIKIELRGNTSQSFAKKSYGFTLYDEASKKKEASLLEFPPSKKWVLYGPYADKSLIRDALSYSLYEQMGNYAPKTQFIDLVINDNYQGIYVLTEKVQISPNHVNISKLNTEKIQGGYLLEIDRNIWRAEFPPKEDTSAIPPSYMVYSPKKSKIDSNVEKIIKTQFNVFAEHLYNNDSIYNYLDLNSFIDHLIITEVAKNIDGYRLSTFIYNKDINSNTPKFYMGPIWDYNFSFGLANYHNGYNPKGYVYNIDKYVPFWWEKLLTDSVFQHQLQNRYLDLRKTTLSNQNINNTIDSLTHMCSSSINVNFKKWPVLNTSDFWPNYYMGETYEDEINYLKYWSKTRLEFLDKNSFYKEH